MLSGIQPLDSGDPREFGGWKLEGLIGEGGFSRIYLGSKGGQLAALKMLKKDFLNVDEVFSRFAQEITNLKSLDHPNIAKYIEHEISTQVPYLATQYISGATLKEFVEINGPLKEAEWRELASSLASTLDFCHSMGVIHKDVSPSNIVMGEHGPVFIDFGLSRLVGDPDKSTFGRAMGTVPFMAPENFGSDRTPAMDSFSLAGTLVFAGAGHYPFNGESDLEWMQAIPFSKPNFAGLTKTQIDLLSPLLYKSSTERAPLSSFTEFVKAYIANDALSEDMQENLSKYLEGSEDKLVAKRLGSSNEDPKSRTKKSIGKLAFAAGVAGLVVVVGINLLGGATGKTTKAGTSSEAAPVSTASPGQLEAAFGGTSEPNSSSAKPSTCSDFSYRDNVEADVLKTCQDLINSGDLNGYYNIGFYYYEQGNAKEAISWWTKGADKKSALSMYRLAGVLYENGETSQAKKWYEACVNAATTDSGKSWCMNGLGKIYFQEKNLKESRRWYQLSADLGDPEGYYRVGLNYGLAEEWQKALDNYLKIKNPNLATKTLIAAAYSGLGKDDQALFWYKKAADDGSADALVNMGVIYYVKKDFDNAIQVWKKASALGSGTASYKLARLYSEQKNTEEAAKYDKVGAAQGEIGSIYFYGFYFQEKEDYKNAKIWYQKGVDRNDPTSMVQLGAILSVIEDDKDGACQLWSRASDLGNSKAKENVQKFCSANPSQTPYAIPSSKDLTRSLPISKSVVVDEIFGRVFESGIDWLIPLSITTDKVPPITGVQFRLVGYPDAPWFGLPYKLKNLQGGVYGQVDDLFLSVLFNRQVCPEFRFVQESKGEIVKIWNKQQPECATDYVP
jgi:serine/threonine protein kinase